ncbi:hypothetical protein SAMN02910447_03354 [Ruminococcus sp. YE71]|uniref:hypothetical protein n=1 Tax=unclassified Ruminococcus TaxID=2608920 RepID=UPI00088F31DA|nr:MULTISPECIES: hypothetical protein [unclassified Ruminococcus]SDA31254.1 hypothetical protein SAMN02910446_03434 [Ruminococcus sp. YE78]SFW51266.1 hypothetical protein SAMN02910447_03354 [Ruminococcus sp. YE71]
MTEPKKARDKRYTISCPRCNKKHIFEGAIFDDKVVCSCGFSFYAFAADDLRIIMPWSEVKCEPVVKAMRRLVVTSGRCTDIPPELYDDSFHDPELTLEKILTEHQTNAFGTCYINEEQLDLICESFICGNDVELKWKRDHLDIIELKKRTIRRTKFESKTSDVKSSGSKESTWIPSGTGLLLSSQPVDNNRIQR